MSAPTLDGLGLDRAVFAFAAAGRWTHLVKLADCAPRWTVCNLSTTTFLADGPRLGAPLCSACARGATLARDGRGR